MIIALVPFEFHGFGHKVFADFMVDVGFVSLAELVTTANAVHPSVLDEVCARLVEAERNVFRDALLAEGENPVVVARSRLHSRLTADGHLFYRLVQIWRKVNGANQRRGDDTLVLDGEREEDGQAVVGHLLILHGASYDDVVVAVAPVVGHTLHETVDAFGEEVEPEVAPLPYHLPAFRSPLVRVFQQEVGGEAGKDQIAALYLPRFVAFALDGQVEVGGLSAEAA